MGDFVKNNNPKQKHHQVKQGRDNNSTSSIQKVQEQCSQKKNQPFNNPSSEKEQEQLDTVKKRKQKHKSYCSPGSMTRYLDFRKKQLENNEMVATGNPILNTETSPIRDENDDDVQLNNIDAGYGLGFDLELETTAENEKEAPKKKHRGPTKLTQVHARTREERQYIILNSFGQPVGPTKEIVEEFKFFLRTLGKDSELAPLNYVNFRDLPTHDKIWDYVLEKYIVPEAGRKYAMEVVNTSWRSYKCRFKKNHFYAYATDELRWKNKPDTISVPQFQDLLNYWKCEKVEL
ncbi:uncharacterized protein [Spinacia oleracea]|uniref:Transposase MuDR plant domain-containing protein n=1 Tax=Spinacia oleracea TaxID=3562 RepID=A0ABM3RNY3_SPIOL|nr:uncharacterized protein LOC130471300 [Spinacia oleracea]